MAASPSCLPVLLPDAARLSVESVRQTEGAIVIGACSITGTATCPACGVCSSRVHSQYRRTLRDLSYQGARVAIQLRSRRFYCRSQGCHRKIFTERFPILTAAHGRQTDRHREALKQIGYALGGEAGSRLASQLGIASSPDTILRVTKLVVGPVVAPPVKALGVDDWAWRKGQRYGTILVDLERHQPIDLLPDRESETLKKWLEAHPGVEIVSRDRAGAYAEGARKGAPEALQVADRFHILCNLTQALQRLLERSGAALRRSQISEAAPSPDASSAGVPTDPSVTTTAGTAPGLDPSKLNRHQQQSQQRRELRKARFEAVRAAHDRGLTQRAIGREFGLTRKTVQRFLQATEFPEQAPRRRRTGLEPYREYLEKRWAEGCNNASLLWRELQKQGYSGQLSRVKEYLQPWRSPEPKPTRRNRKLPGLRMVAFWLAKPAAERKEAEQKWVQVITKDQPAISQAERLAQTFRDMVKNHRVSDLEAWLKSAETSGIPELNGFATGIRRDHAAVTAGIETHWNNGQVEGQVHRLKTIEAPNVRPAQASFSSADGSFRSTPASRCAPLGPLEAPPKVRESLPGFVHDVCSAIHPLAIASPCFEMFPSIGVRPDVDTPGRTASAPVGRWNSRDAGTFHPRHGARTWAGRRRVGEADAAVGRCLAGTAPRRTFRARFAAAPSGDGAFRPARHSSRRGTWRGVSFAERGRGRFWRASVHHSLLPFDAAASAAIGLVQAICAHAGGWPLPRGGAQKIADALASYLRTLGGEIVTGTRVTTLPASPLTLCDVSPRALLSLAGARLPAGFRGLPGRLPIWPGSLQNGLGAGCAHSVARGGVPPRRHRALGRHVWRKSPSGKAITKGGPLYW